MTTEGKQGTRDAFPFSDSFRVYLQFFIISHEFICSAMNIQHN